jgi:hypothetical protein
MGQYRSRILTGTDTIRCATPTHTTRIYIIAISTDGLR